MCFYDHDNWLYPYFLTNKWELELERVRKIRFQRLTKRKEEKKNTRWLDPNTFLLDHLLQLTPVKFLEGQLIHQLLLLVFFESVASLRTLMSVCWLIGRSVDQSFITSNAPIRPLVIFIYFFIVLPPSSPFIHFFNSITLQQRFLIYNLFLYFKLDE